MITASQDQFHWKDPTTLPAILFGTPVEPTSVLENGFGRSIEYVLEPEFGEGRIEYIDAAPDMWIIVLDCVFKQDHKLKVFDAGLVRFNFSLSINVKMRFEGIGDVFANEPSWRVIHNPPDAVTLEEYPKDTPTRWVTISCPPNLIARLTGIAEVDLPSPLDTPMSIETLHGADVHHRYDFSERIKATTAEIVNANIAGPARISYIQARCTELLCRAAMRLTQTDDGPPVRVRLTDRDRETLARIKAGIDADFQRSATIVEISRRYGINRNKLFYGFKDLYGASVSEYIVELRIAEGRRLLVETGVPVSRISEILGFTHPCNFSTAIKKRYGVTPLALRTGG